MPSVRRRLLLGSAAVVVVVVAALAVVLYASVRSWLLAEFDRGLLAQAQALAAVTEVQQGKLKIDFEAGAPTEFLGGRQAQYFELWEAGEPAARSASMQGRDLPLVPAAPDGAYRYIVLPDGRPGRQIALFVRPHPDDEAGSRANAAAPSQATLLVARDTEHLLSALAHLRWLLAGACSAAVLACLGLMAWTVRRGLRPVATIADRIESVGRKDLSDRLEIDGVPRELLPIVHRLNELLQRLHAAFVRERAFSADVAHELRTPLAGLETALEVCSSRQRQPQDYQKVVRHCLHAVRQMHAMVDNLLVLARAEAGNIALERTTFSLPSLIDETWQQFTPRAAERGLRVARCTAAGAAIHNDREKLRIILHNLFDNAVTHADPGGHVRIELAQTNGTAHLTVANSGSRLSDDQLSCVFDRFWRGDAGRADTGAHCGLGLSISKELVQLLGGELAVESRRGGEFRVRLAVPAAK